MTASAAGIPSHFQGGFLTTNVDFTFGHVLELEAPDVVGFTLQNSTHGTAAVPTTKTTMKSDSSHQHPDDSKNGPSIEAESLERLDSSQGSSESASAAADEIMMDMASMMPLQQIGQRLMRDFSACSHASLPAGFMNGGKNTTTMTLGDGTGSGSDSVDVGSGSGSAQTDSTTTAPSFINSGGTLTTSSSDLGGTRTITYSKPSSSTSKTSSTNDGDDEVQGATDVVQPNRSSKMISIVASVISSVVATMVLVLIVWSARRWWIGSERYKRRKRTGILWEHEQVGAGQDDEGKSNQGAAQQGTDATASNASAESSTSPLAAERVRTMLQLDTSPTVLSAARTRERIARNGGSAEEAHFTPSSAAASTPLSSCTTAHTHTPTTTVSSTGRHAPQHVALRIPLASAASPINLTDSPVYESQSSESAAVENPFQHADEDSTAEVNQDDEQPPPQYAESVRSTEITLPPNSDGVMPPNWSHFQLLSPFSPTTVYQHPFADHPRGPPHAPLPAACGMPSQQQWQHYPQQAAQGHASARRPTLTLQRHNTDPFRDGLGARHRRRRSSPPIHLDAPPLSAVVISGRGRHGSGTNPFRDASEDEGNDSDEDRARKRLNRSPRRPSSVGTTRELLDALVDDRSEEHFWQ